MNWSLLSLAHLCCFRFQKWDSESLKTHLELLYKCLNRDCRCLCSSPPGGAVPYTQRSVSFPGGGEPVVQRAATETGQPHPRHEGEQLQDGVQVPGERLGSALRLCAVTPPFCLNIADKRYQTGVCDSADSLLSTCSWFHECWTHRFLIYYTFWRIENHKIADICVTWRKRVSLLTLDSLSVCDEWRGLGRIRCRDVLWSCLISLNSYLRISWPPCDELTALWEPSSCWIIVT